MRGDSQAITGRPLTVSPGKRWSAWIEPMSERRRRDRQERLETIAWLGAERRRALRAGEYAPDLKYGRR
jgi:hypothetical protein